jgi:hypothetical protein
VAFYGVGGKAGYLSEIKALMPYWGDDVSIPKRAHKAHKPCHTTA